MPDHYHRFKYQIALRAMVCHCGFRINEDEAYNFSKLHAERSASVGSPETPTETVYTVNVPAADLDADSVALRVLAADRPEDRIREVVGRILWSKVTAIGGGRCYLNTNLDDVVNELAAALSPVEGN